MDSLLQTGKETNGVKDPLSKDPLPKTKDNPEEDSGTLPVDQPPVVKKVVPVATHYCPECQAEFPVSSELVRHQKLKRHAVFPCLGCKRVFLTDSALGDHVRMTGHKKPDEDGIIVEPVGKVNKSPKTKEKKEKQSKKDPKAAKSGKKGGNRRSSNRQRTSTDDSIDSIDSSWWRRAGEEPKDGEPVVRLLPAKTWRNSRAFGGPRRESYREGTSNKTTSKSALEGRARSSTCPNVNIDLNDNSLGFKPHPAQQGIRKKEVSDPPMMPIGGRRRAATESQVQISDELKEAAKQTAANAVARRRTQSTHLVLTDFEGPLWKTDLELGLSSHTTSSNNSLYMSSSGENSGVHSSEENSSSCSPERSLSIGMKPVVPPLEAITEEATETEKKAAKASKKKKKAETKKSSEDKDGDAEEKVYTCLSCSKTFSSESSLMGHTGGAVSGTKFPCAECGVKFCNRYELSNHRWENQHGVPKPLQCSTCHGLFANRPVLVAHWDGEDRAPPYRGVRCPGCLLMFCSQRAMHQHAVVWGHFAPDHVFLPIPNPYCIRGVTKRVEDKTGDYTIDNPFFNEGSNYLMYRSEHPVIMVTVTNDISVVKAWLHDHVLCMEGEENVVGMDVEWKPVWKKNHPDPNKVALLNFCVEQHALVIQMCQLVEIPGELQFLLASPKFLKVGAGIREDLERIERYYNIFCHGYYDIGVVSSFLLKDVRSGTPLSLANVAKRLCGIKLNKPKTITRSNWELVSLTEAQIHYAATNATASYKIHRVIQHHIVSDLNQFDLDHKIHDHLARLYNRNKAPKDLLSALNNYCGTEKSMEMCYKSLYSQFSLKDACFKTRLAIECVKKGYPIPHFESYEYEAQPGCIHSNVMLKGQVIGASYSFDKSDSLETATEYALNHIMMSA
eukprot:CAMPEP_0117740246 /NCGR_PEP_ID=MMETSP0947-20121206/4230_1 /TAXON_ID=44440 /ORGANISM="Chattonella subsalsa, Strain CCMP2191" /LENGTH=898 /DNA_ID=CAMNT_0005556329 /DNA_START=262 /DNA_END=2958 /DNA_ORIENTATION=+